MEAARDPHTGYIVAAYVVAGVVIASMIFVIVADYIGLRKNLARFGDRGGDGGARGGGVE